MNITQQPLKNSPSDFRPAHKGYPGRMRLRWTQAQGLKLSLDQEAELIEWSRQRLKSNTLFRDAPTVITSQIPVGSA